MLDFTSKELGLHNFYSLSFFLLFKLIEHSDAAYLEF